MASTIGIKVANGEFYPIMEENSSVKKRLILTTVHDKQKSVQIDLYNSFAKTMADAVYIGSLVVENIKPLPKGEPSIEMTLDSNSKGEISAEAVYLDSSAGGVRQHLSVSLTSMEEEAMDGAISDFDLESQDHPPRGLYDKAAALKDEGGKKGFPWAIVAIVGTLILVLGFLLYFFFMNDTGVAIRTGANRRSAPAVVIPSTSAAPSVPVVPAPTTPAPAVPVPVTPPAPVAPAEAVPSAPAPIVPPVPAPVPVISAGSAAAQRSAESTASATPQTPATPAASVPSRRTRNPPVATYKVPQTIPRGGVPYKVRWGDTLWDISEAFYRNPWLYPRIARFNNIRNPDLIISGKTIRIPPRN